MYVEQRSHPALDRWVECTWSMETPEFLRDYAVRPDGCMDILYSPERGLQFVGTMTRAHHFDVEAGELHVGLRFRPGGSRPFVRASAEELRDCTVELDGLAAFATRELRARLDEADSAPARRRLLNDAVKAVIAEAAAPDPVQQAIESLARAHGAADVDWLADQAGMSARQFRRRCVEETGLGPKHLARVLRFRRACNLAWRGKSWPHVAVEAGYFDQAHLIRDFREFAGGTPMSVFSNTADSLAG